MDYEKKVLMTIDMTPAIMIPIIHLSKVSSPEMRVSMRSILASRPSSRRSSLIRSFLVASCESNAYANTTCKASDSALACASGMPAALSFSTNFKVSKVMVATIISSKIQIVISITNKGLAYYLT